LGVVGRAVGRRVGRAVGRLVGDVVGTLVGLSVVGWLVGGGVGRLVGRFVGVRDGSLVGRLVGVRVGDFVVGAFEGSAVGTFVGEAAVGICDGPDDGWILGDDEVGGAKDVGGAVGTCRKSSQSQPHPHNPPSGLQSNTSSEILQSAFGIGPSIFVLLTRRDVKLVMLASSRGTLPTKGLPSSHNDSRSVRFPNEVGSVPTSELF